MGGLVTESGESSATQQLGGFDRFAEVSPELLARRALLRRTDSKFLATRTQLARVLDQIVGHYGILHARGAAVASYQTLYFDTDDLLCFNDHRRGRRARHKVRIRHYIDRELTYLEVKTKTNHQRTVKSRLKKPFTDSRIQPEEEVFIADNCGLDAARLRPQIWTNFGRITLVGLETNERLTIDVDLIFRQGEHDRPLSGVTIVEVKQSPFRARTPVMRALRLAGVRQVSASKYCTATALLRTDVRRNNFLQTLRLMERMQR